jgi:acetyltransferase
MSTYRLDTLLSPRSVAVVGASPRERSVGQAVLRNLREGGFPGPIHVVNPRYAEVGGIRTVGRLADLPSVPDVVVITTPPETVPGIVASAAQIGSAAAIIITAGLGHGADSLAAAAENAAREKGLRLVGPNCLGVIAPAAMFNASFASRMPIAGDLALISQSGAIAAGLIDWAARRAVGFSAVVSIGDQLDVDLGDLLDYFALDRHTRAILLYVEAVKDARKYMSAARAASRAKPVVVVKAGRHAQGARAAATHTGALAGSDAVYDAAFHRAGLLRVLDLGELFDAAATLSRVKSTFGKRLAILTNGGGIGVLAVDSLVDLDGIPAELSEPTRARLDTILPPTWSKSNPVDIIGDADPARYVAALEALLNDPKNDAVLVMNVETAVVPALEIARSVADLVQKERSRRIPPKPVFAVWIGAGQTIADIFHAANIPHFLTEVDAVRGFLYLARHGEALQAAMQTPPSLPEHFSPDVGQARRIVAGVIADARSWLDPIEVTELFRAYSIPIVPALFASNPDEAASAAQSLLATGATVVMKILSRDIIHKSDVGGVRLNLTSVEAARTAAAEIIANAQRLRPDARISGVTLHPMIVRPKARELIAGIAEDPTFGPVIAFGHGGTAVEIIDDKALALPPLDLRLAHDLIARTRVSRLLRAYRDVPAARLDEIALVLVKLAQLAADLPQIRELDINPLLADETGVVSLDARVAVSAETRSMRRGHPRFAVRPYPIEWERRLALGDGWRVLVRPVRPEDEPMFLEFFQHVSTEDLRMRFFAPITKFSHAFIARLTQLDYSRAMAFIAIDEQTEQMIGAVRIHADANFENGEYAILLRSDLKGRGLGWALMQLMIEYARSEGLQRIEGQVLRSNAVMLRMCRELGFRVESDPQDGNMCVVRLPLH